LNLPKLALCNFIPDVVTLKQFALANGFAGVDWTLTLEDLPANRLDESRLFKKIAHLHPLEVRYHLAFEAVDPGDAESARAERAMQIFRRACDLVSRLDGGYLTIHLGLGRDTTEGLSWERTLTALADLVSYGKRHGITVCLENLAWGWSSRPELFEKLIRKSEAGITLDIGHARVCSSVETTGHSFEDFVAPHPEKIINAHIYHEERDDRHLPPRHLDDLRDRLDVLSHLSCDWWVLELREQPALLATLGIVHAYLETMPGQQAETLDPIPQGFCSGLPAL
jgi:sugar phosphate isomerase/epimerase